MKVSNLSSVNGNKVPNQFVIESNDCVWFQSYNSVVAKYEKNKKKLTLSSNWDYSNTTRKFLYSFLERYTPFSKLLYSSNKRKAILSEITKNNISYYPKESINF